MGGLRLAQKMFPKSWIRVWYVHNRHPQPWKGYVQNAVYASTTVEGVCAARSICVHDRGRGMCSMQYMHPRPWKGYVQHAVYASTTVEGVCATRTIGIYKIKWGMCHRHNGHLQN
jgi:hypothetical protein